MKLLEAVPSALRVHVMGNVNLELSGFVRNLCCFCIEKPEVPEERRLVPSCASPGRLESGYGLVYLDSFSV